MSNRVSPLPATSGAGSTPPPAPAPLGGHSPLAPLSNRPSLAPMAAQPSGMLSPMGSQPMPPLPSLQKPLPLLPPPPQQQVPAAPSPPPAAPQPPLAAAAAAAAAAPRPPGPAGAPALAPTPGPPPPLLPPNNDPRQGATLAGLSSPTAAPAPLPATGVPVGLPAPTPAAQPPASPTPPTPQLPGPAHGTPFGAGAAADALGPRPGTPLPAGPPRPPNGPLPPPPSVAPQPLQLPPTPRTPQKKAADGDTRPSEEYIPFGCVELRTVLVVDHPDVFRPDVVRKKFEELVKWISLRNALRLELDYGDAHERYAPLDPDKDTLALVAKRAAAAEQQAAAAGAGGGGGGGAAGGRANTRSGRGSSGGAGSPGPMSPRQAAPNLLRQATAGQQGTTSKLVAQCAEELRAILDKAEFVPLEGEALDKAKTDKSLMGLDVTSASDEYLEFQVYYRGSRMRKVEWRRWGIFKRQVMMNVYERLAISFRLKKPVSKDDLPEEGAVFGVDNRPWYKRLLCGRVVGAAESLAGLRDEFLYMKLFKDVLQCDVDMLLPGSTIKFTWFDYLMVWAPIIAGCGFAVWKAVKGTIDFSNIKNAALSVVLILMPLSWGIRAWFSVKEKQRKHQAHLNALFLTHNLNNNDGVISQLLDEANEQEDNEAMLAYFFLWRGQAQPQPMAQADLDRMTEAYLQRKMDESGVAVRMDYEVADSVAKLERLGLLRTVLMPSGDKGLQVLALDDAVERAHVRHFDEAREVGQDRLVGAQPRPGVSVQLPGAATGIVWYECANVFPATGQAFTYYYNADTGDSQYHAPGEPYHKLVAGEALDVTKADGQAMRDPARYAPPAPGGKAKLA